MNVGSGEIQTLSIQNRVPDQMGGPSLTTVHVTVVCSPEKFCGGACTETTRRSAGRRSTSASTVRVLLYSFDSLRLGSITASAITVTYKPRAAGDRSKLCVFV